MKSMKDMKKAVAEFRTPYIALLAEVTVQPSRLAHFPVWPKAKPLHVLHALHGESSVLIFARTIGLAMAYDGAGFIIWKIFQVLMTL